MAYTQHEQTDPTSIQKWSEKQYRDIRRGSFFDQFAKEDENSFIQVKRDLNGDVGNKVTFTLIPDLYGEGVTSRVTLTGNEESLNDYTFDIELEEYAHAVASRGPIDRRRPVWRWDPTARRVLKDWGMRKIDRLMFKELTDSPSTIFYETAGGITTGTVPATVISALTSANSRLDSTDIITHVKAAVSTGYDAENDTSYQNSRVLPVRMDGDDYYMIVVHPYVFADFKRSDEYKQLNREARERSKSNPLFTNAKFCYDNVIVFEHERVPLTRIDASNAYCKAIFLGKQGGCWAWGMNPKFVPGEITDYQREQRLSIQMICKAKKPQFNGKDFGSAAVYFHCRNYSGKTA